MMLSMTAFSRQQLNQDGGDLTWEIRSVNHRYLEVSLRLPEQFRNLENRLRENLRSKLSRGKVECQLRYQPTATQTFEIDLNEDIIRQLVTANTKIENLIGKSSPLSSIDILRWPGVIQEQQSDSSQLEQQAFELFDAALVDLIANRQREGNELKKFLEQRLTGIADIVTDIRSKMPIILQAQHEALTQKLKDLQVDLDPARMEQEVAILAQKADVDEELDRLDSHLKEVSRVIATNGAKGRRLDFLMQELNREANTLSSKSVVADTTLNAVELKVLIEQMREQIQNVE